MKEHLIAPPFSLSVCHIFQHIVGACLCKCEPGLLLMYTIATLNWGHCWITLLQQLARIPFVVSVAFVIPLYRAPRCIVRNTFRISVYSKEYTFLILCHPLFKRCNLRNRQALYSSSRNTLFYCHNYHWKFFRLKLIRISVCQLLVASFATQCTVKWVNISKYLCLTVFLVLLCCDIISYSATGLCQSFECVPSPPTVLTTP